MLRVSINFTDGRFFHWREMTLWDIVDGRFAVAAAAATRPQRFRRQTNEQINKRTDEHINRWTSLSRKAPTGEDLITDYSSSSVYSNQVVFMMKPNCIIKQVVRRTANFAPHPVAR